MTNREEIERRRTFAIISHPDAGKTTLTEKLLLYGGAINQAGSVKGKQSARHAVSDWMDIEKQRGISVTSSVLQFDYAGKCVNILDTPGHQDFSEDTPNNNLPGGGVGLNYGIYYMTALISLLGPVEEVSALVRNPKPVRINRLPGHPDFGKEYASPNESQIAASLRMGNGVIGTFFLNGESILSDLALFCLYGTKGVLRLTDANQFGGQVTLIKNTSDYFHPEEIPLDYGLPYEKDSRGVGPAEMAAAILSGRESRTDKAMAIHVLDVFCAMERSSEKGRRAVVNSTCRRPEAFREGTNLFSL